MSFGFLEVFGIAADCFQVLMIAVMIFLMLRYRKKMSTPDWSEWASSEANPFMHEFLLQSLKHQSEQAFDHIEKTIRVERSNLLQLLELNDQQIPRGDIGKAEPETKTVSFTINDTPQPEESVDSDNSYEEVIRLAAEGMNSRRIAKQLSIPLGEVELVMKMNPSGSSNRLERNGRRSNERRRVAR